MVSAPMFRQLQPLLPKQVPSLYKDTSRWMKSTIGDADDDAGGGDDEDEDDDLSLWFLQQSVSRWILQTEDGGFRLNRAVQVSS